MNINWPILSVVTFLPLLGALLVLLLARGNGPIAKGTARWVAMWTTLVTFAISLVLVWRFDPTSPEFQFVEKHPWLGVASYHMGVDGISLPFVILTTALMPICILASWTVIQKRVKEYMIAFLVLETLMIGTFSALDLVLFYLFFEGGLIPMFLIIGVWGGPRRVYASFKFFLYTLLGSVLMLLAIMAMYWEAGTTDIPALLHHGFPLAMQKWAWLAFFASFAVKLPMWPVHTWLPDAHVEAPTAGSVVLAAILLKMGGYGFLRFSLPMFPAASHDFAPMIFTLSVVAIIYTSLVALMQEDVKKLIAYSSVAHMGFVTMGIFALTPQGVAGGIFQMISHGIVSGALFLCVGVVYDRMHTREIAFYGGLVNRMPVYAAVFMVFTLANVGLPGTSGFVGEFLSLIGTYKANIPVATIATLGVILSAAYALWLYRKMIFGTLKPALVGIKDMGWREIFIFTPLVVLTILFGVAPKPVLDMSAASVTQLLDNYKHAIAALPAPDKVATTGAAIKLERAEMIPASAAR
jgi:NADH-quinone oxidoreductase subunit M